MRKLEERTVHSLGELISWTALAKPKQSALKATNQHAEPIGGRGCKFQLIHDRQ